MHDIFLSIIGFIEDSKLNVLWYHGFRNISDLISAWAVSEIHFFFSNNDDFHGSSRNWQNSSIREKKEEERKRTKMTALREFLGMIAEFRLISRRSRLNMNNNIFIICNMQISWCFLTYKIIRWLRPIDLPHPVEFSPRYWCFFGCWYC